MAPSRPLSNGRSPLVNQQKQITSFFTKSSSSPSPLSLPSKQIPKSQPNPIPKLSPSPTTPSPLQSKNKKPVLVIGSSPISHSTLATTKKSHGQEAVNRRVRVYWPLDQSWYEGCVKSFDKISGKHLVQYDDAEEEFLDLSKEKIELVEEEVKRRFRRLRCVSVIEDEGEEFAANAESGGDDDDSADEDWGKNGETEEAEDGKEGTDLEEEDDDDEDQGGSVKRKQGKDSESRKRKITGGNSAYSKKRKSDGDPKKSILKVSLDGNGGKVVEPKVNDIGKTAHAVYDGLVGDAAERFGTRERQKLHFLGDNRRDANRRRPGDLNYDPRTLYLPPDFLKSLTGGQRQWWEFKAKHMDKVIFFKMGKFYELFEMDAHVGVKELDLQYMKGEQPHCGFPEKNFSMNVEKLARKGYRVLAVEQTETPEQLELRRRETGSKDKVVKREICAVVTKGTLTEGEMMSANPEASYMLAVTESCQTLEHEQGRIFGICVVDAATSKVILGQFQDDSECSALCCLLSELRPVEIIKPAKLLSPETERVLLTHTRCPLVNELVPLSEFWDAEKTVSEVKAVYRRFHEQSIALSTNEANLLATGPSSKDTFSSLPDVLLELVNAGNDGSYALSALGGTLFYLKQAFLDETLLRFAKFEPLPCAGFSNIGQKPYMILDASALENLEIFENSRNGDSSGTLYAQLDHCVTAFGKRLLKSWLARPLYHLDSIRERQDAVGDVKGVNLPFALEFRKDLSRLPDMERLLARIFASSEGNGRNANKVVLYEDAAKKQLQEFISALRGCELMTQACSALGVILENVESRLLHHLLTPGKSLSDVHSVLKHFKDAFDWVEANNSGRIIPHDGVDTAYDSACRAVMEVESGMKKHLKEQRKLLGDASINYVTIGKDAYLLEVPESLSGIVPQNYELRSSKKGFFRYWTPNIKKLIGELSQAESEKESKLKSILQRLVGCFSEHHNKWRQLVSTVAELDVLISLAIASDYYEGPTCRPIISGLPCPDEVPFLRAKSLGHPVLRSDSLGRNAFVPNDVTIGSSGHANFILLTGPNMGGKSTLLRQICLATILVQVGADVPAESFEMSPVDRIFVRMGAKDHIMAGQSTFLTELLETASMLSSATHNSLVALDELGRGTSTSDGQAIAESVLEHFVHDVQCRGMFSTHYHRLAVDNQHNPKVSLSHMACKVGKGVGDLEEVTFLYRLTPGACPKSYGVNVARLAGLPDTVLHKATAKSREFEGMYGKHRKLPIQSAEDKMRGLIRHLIEIATNLNFHETADERIGVSSLSELQNRARMLLKQN
ncbi:DNA mismatch repair protein [Actinidia chinensis var. chinensis]|uniref:DNA mismatch repair protein n=1 Tax=Actinidia chinensis var. chinensis TaxID=1590841 RepID=A0A2R6QUB5_ACTCC|nr:DNA mismatch repair protein [Actinidia chinensis var. chinensis]